jgi:hypothetical protein
VQQKSGDGLPPGYAPFLPRRGLTNGHVQTIVGNYLPRPALRLKATTETVLVDPADSSRVLCHCHWQADPTSRLTLVMVHGLEGSSDSGYIHGLTMRAWAVGCNVVRMNMRNCGDTEQMTPTLYDSSMSGDLGAVVEHCSRKFGLGRVALVGYSMGGNLVLKLAGEWGARAPLAAVAAVCPAVDLAAGSDALHEPLNRIYEWHFLQSLMARFRRKTRLYPKFYGDGQVGPTRSIRDFDNKIVARFCGYRDADDYYRRAAAARVVDRIAVPTLILAAADDPFVRLTPETRAKIEANPAIRFVETRHGGHCAFLGREPGQAIHWAEATVIRYLLQVTGEKHGS